MAVKPKRQARLSSAGSAGAERAVAVTAAGADAAEPIVPTWAWVRKAAVGSEEYSRREARYLAHVQSLDSLNGPRVGVEDQDGQAKIYQMQLWPDDKRAMPTDFIACALFAAVQMKHAPRLRGEQIASINGFTITVTGQRLTQVHADVLMGIAHLAREEPQGYIARFSHRAFLRLIGRANGSNSVKSLRQLVDDLMGMVIRITYPNGRSLSGHVLEKSRDDGATEGGEFAVLVTRELCEVFSGGFALVDWQQRLQLKKKPLALWLQLYFSQFHRPVELKELHRLSGSADALRFFRRRVKHELETLKKLGAIQQFYLDDKDVLHIAAPGGPLPERFRTAVLPPTISNGGDRAAQRATLPAVPAVSDTATAKFRELYPQLDPERCLSDWRAWTGSRNAKNPDRAWLGFAKNWALEHAP